MKKRWMILAAALIATLALAACAQAEPAPVVDEAAQARIAELEAALTAAEAEGSASAGELDAMRAELEAEIENLEGEVTSAKQAQCTYNAYRMGWIMDWADAGNMVDTVWGPTSDFQYSFWQLSNPEAADEFAALTLDAYRDTDLERRSATWQEAEKIVVEELAAVIPLYHYDRQNMINQDLNFFYPPFGSPRIAQWSFKSGRTTMYVALATSVPTLDIQEATDTTSHWVLAQMIDHPFTFNAEGGIEPSAATSFDVSADGTVFTVHLREDAVWSDGVPVTAQHFVDGISRLLSPELANDYAYVMFDVAGAADFNSGDAPALDSVRAVDDFTLEITLSEPRSYFDSILAFFTLDPVRLDVIEAHGVEWTRPGNFVSNGAYVLAEHSPGEGLVLEKNELYWDAENVAVDRIEVSILLDPATSLAAFEAGELDVTNAMSGGFPPEDIPRLVDMPEFVRLPRPGTYYMGVNTTAQHTNNVVFRKALATAVDKRAILDNVAETPWRTEAYGITPPEIVGYSGDAVGYSFDVTAAVGFLEAYMADAGIADPGDIVVELWYNKSGANQEILEAVEAMWEENLGIDVRTVNVEWASYLETLEECNAVGGGGF